MAVMQKAILVGLCLVFVAAGVWIAYSHHKSGTVNANLGRAASGTAGAATEKRAENAAPLFKVPAEPLLVVQEHTGSDPVQGKLLLIGVMAPDVPEENSPPPSKDENAASYYFATKYFQQGARFKLYKSGSPAGEAVVTGLVQRQCDARGAVANAEPDIQLGSDAFALATNSPQITTHPNYRRAATGAEITAALDTVGEILTGKGVSADRLIDVKTESLTFTAVDEKFEGILIGSFSLKTKTDGYKLFIILGKKDGRFQTQYLEYETHPLKELTAEMSEWLDRPIQNFVDQLDLDGDGIDELVTVSIGYEGGDFVVYKLQGEKWVQVFRGGEGGC